MENNFIQMAAAIGHAVAYTEYIIMALRILCFKASIVSGLST